MQAETKALYWKAHTRNDKMAWIITFLQMSMAVAMLVMLPQLDGFTKENAGDYLLTIVNMMIVFGMFIVLGFVEMAVSFMLPVAKCAVCKHSLKRHENSKGEIFATCKGKPLDALTKKNSCSCTHFE